MIYIYNIYDNIVNSLLTKMVGCCKNGVFCHVLRVSETVLHGSSFIIH